MKLGAALSERARLQRKLSELRIRINANVTTQEGLDSAEDPNELLNEVVAIHLDLAHLIARINLANATNFLPADEHGWSITEALAERDRLAGLVSTFTMAADAAQKGPQDRWMRTELATVRKVDVRQLRKSADQSAALLRKLDEALQAANWSIELG
jgi:hypothetical protein